MQLIFKQPHISITQFSTVELPDLTVLTGVNGSGKSHLLDAIVKNHVELSGVASNSIAYFNYETFKLENENAYNGQQLAEERESAWQFHQTNIRKQATSWRSTLGEHYQPLKERCTSEKKSLWSISTETVKAYKQQIKNHFQNKNLKSNAQAQGIYSLAKKLPYSLDEIDKDSFVELYKPFSFKNDFLPHQLGKIFWDYYVKYRSNQINEFENEKHGKNYRVLTEQEFIAAHGEKPWDVVNNILATFDTLKYQVNSPEGFDYFGNFQLKLKHLEKPGLEIDFASLSSGERILMALVASVYKSSSDGNFPDVLLLDEVDASLHPSMMKNMLDVINNIFLAQGVKVILVTHSPTTIALSPDESVFVMNRSGTNRIEKKSRNEALEILTAGFATLDQGLKLFDEVSNAGLTIITEGYNTLLLEKALRLSGINDVEVIKGVEDGSGKNQLKTIFDFFSKVKHENKVVIVWDCDANFSIEPKNRTYPYFIPKNTENHIAKKGIENAFPSSLFEDFKKTIILSNGNTTEEFDGSRKRDFETHVLNRNTIDDFMHFNHFIEEIKNIMKL